MFFKAIKLVYEMGRKKAYSEIIAQLESSRSRLTQNRDGALVNEQIILIVQDLKTKQADEETL